MLPALLLLSLAILCAGIGIVKAALRAKSRGEFALITRLILFSLAGSTLFLAILWKAPMKYVVLALAPLFFLSAITQRLFQSVRSRTEDPSKRSPDLDRMKRLN